MLIYTHSSNNKWEKAHLVHPSTFETLAMDSKRKKIFINDLNKFINRKYFYNRVGRAWKRGYILYGPPGIGKTSLVAAIANYLGFDLYDLQLGVIKDDSGLRRLISSVGNRSILLVEDIDSHSIDLGSSKVTSVFVFLSLCYCPFLELSKKVTSPFLFCVFCFS